MEIVRIDDSTIKILIDENLYDLVVVEKTFYWYLKEYVVTINLRPDKKIEIYLEKLDTLLSNSDIKNLTKRIKRDLLDFSLRNKILQETKNVRDLLIAKAFSNSDQFDEMPPGTLRDTVDENNFK
jgi:His-Xaa-Ser system protein HxsD